jgi:acetyl-CoA synthetase
MSHESGAGSARVGELLAMYGASDARVCDLLCDWHPADHVAFSLIEADMTATDLTYGTLRRESEALAGSLRAMGAKRGDRIATLMGKRRELLVALMAIWRLGAVHVPLFTAFAPPAIAYRLDASGCRFVFCEEAQEPKLHELIDDGARSWRAITTGPSSHYATALADLPRAEPVTEGEAVGGDGPIVQIYTSGTTGAPKGVLVPARALAAFQAYLEFGLDVRADDVYWNAADPGWAYGLYWAVLAPLVAGLRALFLCAPFTPEMAFKVLETFKVTNFTAAPTVYRAMLGSESAAGRRIKLRAASSAGEPLTPEVNAWAVDALGVEVRDHYGQTEAGMIINNHQHPALREPVRPGSMGKPMPGWAIDILGPDLTPLAVDEVGVVAVDLSRSPLAWFKGYVDAAPGQSDKFSADGRWYLTGDMGRIDADGYVYFIGRDDDVILMAGYRIGPFEIESVIVAHVAIAECAVVAVPDTMRGEVLQAVVVLKSGFEPSAALVKELQTWVKTGYAAHAYPRAVHFAESLPKTPSGKVQRNVIRQALLAKA